MVYIVDRPFQRSFVTLRDCFIFGSYDNNVYFSIFCEHRQLKHGMHVIDPSREVSSHCMTVQVGTSGYKWLQVVLYG